MNLDILQRFHEEDLSYDDMVQRETELYNSMRYNDIIGNALCFHAGQGNLGAVKRLVKHKNADVNVHNGFPLRMSAMFGKTDVVIFLLRHGADSNALDNAAIRYSAFNGHDDIVRILIKCKANIHVNEDEPLRKSSENGHFNTVKILLKYGAKPTAMDNYAVVKARQNGYNDIADYIEEFMKEDE